MFLVDAETEGVVMEFLLVERSLAARSEDELAAVQIRDGIVGKVVVEGIADTSLKPVELAHEGNRIDREPLHRKGLIGGLVLVVPDGYGKKPRERFCGVGNRVHDFPI